MLGETSRKHRPWRGAESFWLVSTSGCWVGGHPGAGGAGGLLLYSLPSPLCTSSPWLLLTGILCNKLVIASEALFWVLANYWTWKGGAGGTPDFAAAKLDRRWVPWAVLGTGIWSGAVLWGWACKLWGKCWPQAVSVRTALNCRAPSRCPESCRTGCWHGKPTHLVSERLWTVKTAWRRQLFQPLLLITDFHPKTVSPSSLAHSVFSSAHLFSFHTASQVSLSLLILLITSNNRNRRRQKTKKREREIESVTYYTPDTVMCCIKTNFKLCKSPSRWV